MPIAISDFTGVNYLSTLQPSRCAAPRTSSTPNTPVAATNMASCPPLPHQQQGPTTSGVMPQTTAAPIHPQPIAPVLSAVGRVPGTGVTNTQIPQKDADGKFPCPLCTKKYLHARHLKRHLLRHTGCQPYECSLCGKRFSRSDTLKKHFTKKCSIKNGNPTGASHLSHLQSHVKENTAAQQQAQPQLGLSTSRSGIQPPLPEATATDIVAAYQPETDTAGNDVLLGELWSEHFDSASLHTASNLQSAPDSGSECLYDSAFPSKMMASDLQSAPRLDTSAYPLDPLENYHRYEED